MMQPQNGHHNKSKFKSSQFVYVICGFLAFGLGTAGIFLPILPTVPFYLLASFCFANGSEKCERWLKSTRLYKERVYFFDKHRVMTLQSQLSILIFVSAILAVTCLLTDNVAVAIVLPVASACQYLYFIFKIKLVTKAELEQLKNEGEP